MTGRRKGRTGQLGRPGGRQFVSAFGVLGASGPLDGLIELRAEDNFALMDEYFYTLLTE